MIPIEAISPEEGMDLTVCDVDEIFQTILDTVEFTCGKEAAVHYRDYPEARGAQIEHMLIGHALLFTMEPEAVSRFVRSVEMTHVIRILQGKDIDDLNYRWRSDVL